MVYKENLGNFKMSILKSMHTFQIISYLVLVSWISSVMAVQINLYIQVSMLVVLVGDRWDGYKDE